MTQRHILIITLTVIISALSISSLFAESQPVLNNGKKWRIGYYEGGPYSDYKETMKTLIMGLIDLKWIQETDLPEVLEETPMPYLDWLQQIDSPYLIFSKEHSYSANWNNDQRERIRNKLLQQLRSGDLDLVIAMGTWAGQDLATKEHTIPVMVLSTSDPIRAGIIKSIKNSGYDHVTARVDPTRYLRQLRMFHRIVDFKTLGIAYEDTPDGRLYSAVADIEQVSRERGFKVLTCKVLDTNTETEKADQSCLKCYSQLAEKADAIYVTALTCADRKTEELANIFRNAGKPSFSMMGSKYVKKGLMLSISTDSGYTTLGRYNASKLGEILNGTKPGKLNQLFEDPLDIAVNLETSNQIGFKIPRSVLKIATEIYGQ